MHEGSRLSPQSPYGQSKALAEEIHRRWREAGSGRRLVIARPGVVFGPGERGNYTALANALRKGYFAYPGKRTTVKSGGYVDELLDAITFAISKDAPEVLFNFAYPDTSTTEDIVSTMGGVMGRRFRPPTAPAALLRMAAHLLKPMRHFGVPNSIAPERVLKLVQSTKIEPRWLKDNGYAFRTDLRRALELWRDETSGRFD